VLLKLIVTLLTLQAVVHADSKWKKAWLASVAFHAAGSAFDAFTSYHRGPYETNPILGDANGQFGNKAVTIKLASFAGVTLAQWSFVRKRPRLAQFCVPINVALGGTYFYLGRHNQAFLKNH
jgi:hypothetical protein